MGRRFWTKHRGDGHDDHKQPGCISGLIDVLDYHHWHSNTRKMIHQNKYAGQRGDWSPDMNLLAHDSSEVEKLVDEKQSPFLKTKRARVNNKRSLKSRIKALIAEEVYNERNNAQTKEGFLFKSRLQRTYSIHHLESLDDSISKICTDWKNSIFFIPSKVENSAPRSVDITQTTPAYLNEASDRESDFFRAAKIGLLEKTDFLDILKIDKELFVRNFQTSDESLTHFSPNSNASKGKLKLSRSRSFPDLNFSQRLKLKPSKLVDKQKEIWSFPKGEKLQAVSGEKKVAHSEEKDQDSMIKGEIQQRNDLTTPSDITQGVIDVREETTMGRVGEKTMRNYSQSRSSSLNESLYKYARFFGNSYGTDAKLNLSRSLRLTNENGHASMYSRRIRSRSLSNTDYFYSNLNLGVDGEDAFGNDAFVGAKDDNFRQEVAEDEEREPLELIETVECKTESVDDMQRMDNDSGLNSNVSDEGSDFEEEAQKLKSGDFSSVPESINGSDPCLISGSCTVSQEKLYASEQLKISEDKFVKSVGHAMDSVYVKLILDHSGIGKDASERPWHASEQPLSPQILEEVTALCPHEHDQLTSWHDFCSTCWQHQMLFDLVNETLVETYDVSLPYYPKPLSSSCHVRPFPEGNRIVEEMSTSIGKLLDLRTDEKQSLDRIMAHDLKDDYRWINLRFESECIGLELEDMVFDGLVEELVCF